MIIWKVYCTCVSRGKLLPFYCSHFQCNHEEKKSLMVPNTLIPLKKQPKMSFCLRVELYEKRKKYLKQTFCNSNDSMLRQNDKMKWLYFLSPLSLSNRLNSFYHTTQLGGVTVYFLWLTWLICDVTQWQMSTLT